MKKFNLIILAIAVLSLFYTVSYTKFVLEGEDSTTSMDQISPGTYTDGVRVSSSIYAESIDPSGTYTNGVKVSSSIYAEGISQSGIYTNGVRVSSSVYAESTKFEKEGGTVVGEVNFDTVTVNSVYAQDMHVSSVVITVIKSTEVATDGIYSDNYDKVNYYDNIDLQTNKIYNGNGEFENIQAASTTIASQLNSTAAALTSEIAARQNSNVVTSSQVSAGNYINGVRVSSSVYAESLNPSGDYSLNTLYLVSWLTAGGAFTCRSTATITGVSLSVINVATPLVETVDTTNNCITRMWSTDTSGNIGTMSGYGLRFYTNSTQRMFLASAGRLYFGSGLGDGTNKAWIEQDTGRFGSSDTFRTSLGADLNSILTSTGHTTMCLPDRLEISSLSACGTGIYQYWGDTVTITGLRLYVCQPTTSPVSVSFNLVTTSYTWTDIITTTASRPTTQGSQFESSLTVPDSPVCPKDSRLALKIINDGGGAVGIAVRIDYWYTKP